MSDPELLIEQQLDDLLAQPDFDGMDPRIFQRADKQINLKHHYIRSRLIEIYGPHGWSEEDLELKCIRDHRDERSGETIVAYMARQRLTVYPAGGDPRSFDGGGAWGTAMGGGGQNGTGRTVWDMHSDALNGARSVAFCRAAKSLGPQFGLSFYDDDPTAFQVRYCLPRDIQRQLAEERNKAEQLELKGHFTTDPDSETLSH